MNDITEQVVCPICKRPVSLGYPESVEYAGQTIHKECAAQAEAEAQAGTKGRNPNNSYT